MRNNTIRASYHHLRSLRRTLGLLGLSLMLLCALPLNAQAQAQPANSDKIELPPATLKQLQEIIDAAPFKCSLSIGIKHKDSYTTYDLGYQGAMKSASIIKVPFVLELYRNFQEGRLDPDDMILVRPTDVVPDGGVLPLFGVGREFNLRELARLAIIPSDCTAANLVLEQVGVDNVNTLCQKLGLRDTVCEGRFYETGRTHNRTNRTSARDMVEMLRALDSGEALNDPWRTEVLQMMHRQWFIEKLVGEMPDNTWYAGKVGEVDGVRNDLEMIIKGDVRLYMCGLTAEVQQGSLGDRTLSRLARIVYDALP